MLEPESVDKLCTYIKTKYPELTDEEKIRLAERYLLLGRLLLGLWIKHVEKSSKDPPK